MHSPIGGGQTGFVFQLNKRAIDQNISINISLPFHGKAKKNWLGIDVWLNYVLLYCRPEILMKET